MFRSAPLPAGPHTLRIVCAGRKQERSRGAYISVDALRIEGAGPAVPWADAVLIPRMELPLR